MIPIYSTTVLYDMHWLYLLILGVKVVHLLLTY